MWFHTANRINYPWFKLDNGRSIIILNYMSNTSRTQVSLDVFQKNSWDLNKDPFLPSVSECKWGRHHAGKAQNWWKQFFFWASMLLLSIVSLPDRLICWWALLFSKTQCFHFWRCPSQQGNIWCHERCQPTTVTMEAPEILTWGTSLVTKRWKGFIDVSGKWHLIFQFRYCWCGLNTEGGTHSTAVVEVSLRLGSTKPLKSELRYYCFTQPVLFQRGSQPNYGHLISYMIDNQWNTMIPPRFVWISLLYIYISLFQGIIFKAVPRFKQTPPHVPPFFPQPRCTLRPQGFGLHMWWFCQRVVKLDIFLSKSMWQSRIKEYNALRWTNMDIEHPHLFLVNAIKMLDVPSLRLFAKVCSEFLN